jgi:hypothetical protein
MALTANREIDHYVDQVLRTVHVAAGMQIFKGAFVEWDLTGHARPVTGSGRFAGIAYEAMDNTTGATGAVSGRVYTLGDFGLPLVGATRAAIGQAVYASDDATLTLDAPNAIPVGTVRDVPTVGWIVLRLESNLPTGVARVEHRVASFSCAVHQQGTTFTNLGAPASITASLPQNAPRGTSFHFVCMAGRSFRIAPGPGAGVYVKGARQPNDHYVQISDIGDFLHLVADGHGDWVAVASIGRSEADIVVQV